MLRFLPAPIVGIIALIGYGLNSLIMPWLIFGAALLRFIPLPNWQKKCTYFLNQSLVYWTDINNFIIRHTTRIHWDIQGIENLKANDWYLIICNHQTWTDIFVLNYIFNRKIPALKFFMKKELLWHLPFAGLAAKLAGFPLMHRHSKEYLAKHPEQKGKDIEITRKACEQFKDTPTTVISFVEGTRFTPEKQQRQASPYQYLLRPKAGGIAFSLAAMGTYFHKLLNVTIVYPEEKPTLWKFCCGKITRIIVRVEVLPITEELLGDYENDRKFRVSFQSWINSVWQTKDHLITKLLSSS